MGWSSLILFYVCDPRDEGMQANHRSWQLNRTFLWNNVVQMYWAVITAAFLVLGLSQADATAASSNSAEDRKTSESTGITVDDLGRGLKSAAKNIENEIPKFGSAIGSAVKKITEKGSENTSSRKPAKQDK
jgi:hypothetical protein